MATKKKSNYDGYVGDNKKEKSKSAAYGMSVDYEGMRSAYNTYSKKGEPDSSKTEKQLRAGDEKAAERVQRTGRDSDNERTRESRRTAGRPSMSRKWTE
jgi:hypothetical protein